MLALALAACWNTGPNPEEIAAGYAEEHWPGSTMGPDGNVMAPVAEDQGEYWQVSFKLPKGWSGGTPKVKIRKSDGTVFDPDPGQ